MADFSRRDLGAFMLPLGAIALLAALIYVVSTLLFIAGSYTATGEVISVQTQGSARYPLVEFVDVRGQAVQINTLRELPFLQYAPGERVALRYRPGNPLGARRAGLLYLFGPALACLLAGGALAAAGNRMSPQLLLAVRETLGLQRDQSTAAFGGEPAEDAAPYTPPSINAGQEARARAVPVHRMRELQNDPNLFGVLKPLVDDPKVNDIIVSHYGQVAVRRGHKIERAPLAFESQAALESYIDRLLLAAGATYSVAKPIADAALGPLGRIHVVHSVLSENGPYLTIRLSRFNQVKEADLIGFGMAPAEIFSYLKTLVLGGQTLLVAGEVGTGKTTLLRALASAIPAHQAILVIEDTPEIKIEHPQVRYIRTREANIEGIGRIPPSECIWAGLRMSMDHIIFGEIREPEAAEAFIDVCVSGHPGLSTIHARNANDAVNRLRLLLARRQPGISTEALNGQIATAVQAIVYTGVCRRSGRLRVMDVLELAPSPDGGLRRQEMFRYDQESSATRWQSSNSQSFFAAAAAPVR